MNTVTEFPPAPLNGDTSQPSQPDGSHDAGVPYDPHALADLETQFTDPDELAFNPFAKPDIYAKGIAHKHQERPSPGNLTAEEKESVDARRKAVGGVVLAVAERLGDKQMEAQSKLISASIADAWQRHQEIQRRQDEISRRMLEDNEEGDDGDTDDDTSANKPKNKVAKASRFAGYQQERAAGAKAKVESPKRSRFDLAA